MEIPTFAHQKNAKYEIKYEKTFSYHIHNFQNRHPVSKIAMLVKNSQLNIVTCCISHADRLASKLTRCHGIHRKHLRLKSSACERTRWNLVFWCLNPVAQRC